MIKPARFEIQRYASIATIALIACLFFCLSLRSLFALEVEISKFEAVSTNDATDVVVTLAPLSVTEEVYLTLRAIEGTGGAVFLPGGHTSTNISQTSTLQIIGEQSSTVEGNMILEARVKEMVVASNIFTVVDASIITENKTIKTMPPEKKDKIRTKEEMITKSKAIEVARVAATTRGKMKIKEGAPITVELKDRDYIVTFGSNLPKGSLGSDYTAKVTLDAFTGAVKKILGAP